MLIFFLRNERKCDCGGRIFSPKIMFGLLPTYNYFSDLSVLLILSFKRDKDVPSRKVTLSWNNIVFQIGEEETLTLAPPADEGDVRVCAR